MGRGLRRLRQIFRRIHFIRSYPLDPCPILADHENEAKRLQILYIDLLHAIL
jgi:hypothetical protein